MTRAWISSVVEIADALDATAIGALEHEAGGANNFAEAAVFNEAADVLRAALKLGTASAGAFNEESDSLIFRAGKFVGALSRLVTRWRREERMMIARMARDRRKGYAILDSYKDRVDEYDRVHFHNGAYDDDDTLETS